MEASDSYWIDAAAARALADWKAFFAEQVSLQAKQIAKNEKSSGAITINHYRRAAAIAAQMLLTTINDSESTDGRQEAA